MRNALGARPVDVIELVVRQGLVVTFGGLAIGILVSNAFVRYLATLLYGVAPYDWLTFLAAPTFILAVTVIACLIPAFRAARIEPLTALRKS